MTERGGRQTPALHGDPVTFEVIRHKLLAITEEQRITFQSISGSPVVTEASDYFTGLFLADGTIVTMGNKVVSQGGPMTLSIRLLQELFPREQLRPGDAFLANDPYRAALHQNDVQVLAPLFFDGAVQAWAGFGAHEVDVGGMDFASWCPKARDVYQEGIRIPGLKIADAGQVREDVWQFVLTCSRLPQLLDLDLRGMLAAAHVSQRRMAELMERYGPDTVQAAMQHMLEQSERKLRDRLLTLADGRFRAIDFLEHDGHEDRLYRVSVTVTKLGDSLDLDFSDSSDQAPGFVNCTRAGLRGGVCGALFPSLAYDIPWNEGLLRPVTIRSRHGSLCDARFPAPVGAASVEAVWVVKNALVAALSKLKACSPGMEDEVQAVSAGTMATINLGGTDQYGQRYGIHLLDPLLSGFGAYAGADGLDVAGSYSTPVPNIANVESNENLSPMLYLHRRLEPDTGGAGERRGGLGASMAFTAHAVPSTEALIMTHGLEVPNSLGLFGGLPGACVRQRLLRGPGSGVQGPESNRSGLSSQQSALSTPKELGPKPGLIELRAGDVFETSWQGGGGLGDPLDRDPALVAADMLGGWVSSEVAERIYGAKLTASGDINPEATPALRAHLRAERLKRAVMAPEAPDVAFGTEPPLLVSQGPGVTDSALNTQHSALAHIGGPLFMDETSFVCVCNRLLARRSDDWHSGAALAVLEADDLGPQYRLHPQLELRQFLCPSCGRQLSVEVAEKGSPVLRDIELA